jgi:hypothetical protein
VGASFDAVTRYLVAEEWPIEKLEGRDDMLRTGYRSNQGSKWPCFAKVREEEAQFIFYSVYPETVPSRKIGQVGEFLHRANLGLTLGNFELDWDDGEVRFKTSVDFEGMDLTPTLMYPVVYANVAQMEHYFGALSLVIAGGASPREAIAQADSA